MKAPFSGVAQCGQNAKGFMPEILGIGFVSRRKHHAAARLYRQKQEPRSNNFSKIGDPALAR
jgi:hypothetical protein